MRRRHGDGQIPEYSFSIRVEFSKNKYKEKINIAKVVFNLHFLILSFKLSPTSCTLIYSLLWVDLWFNLSCVPSSQVSSRLHVYNAIECFCLVTFSCRENNLERQIITYLCPKENQTSILSLCYSHFWGLSESERQEVPSQRGPVLFPSMCSWVGSRLELSLDGCAVRHSDN